jgi:mercuric ion transport protein
MLLQKSSEPARSQGRFALLLAGVAAILASTCCLGPLVLLLLGFSGAWIGNLTLLEPYRPYFLALATVALVLAWRRIWRPSADCRPGEVCALPQVGQTYRWLFTTVVLLALLALAFPLLAPMFY